MSYIQLFKLNLETLSLKIFTLIQTVKNNTNSINIFGIDYSTKDGTGERDYIHIQDLVDGHMQAMKKIRDLKNNNFYNLGTGNPVSVLELVDTFNSVNNLAVKKNFVERMRGINWDTYHNDLPFNPSALSLYKWAPIAEELKNLDRKIVLNSVILKWNVVKKEFDERIKF